MRARLALSFLGFVAVSALANLATVHFGLVPIGFGLMVTAGTFAAGAALVLRDAVHELGGSRVAFAAVAVGTLVSAVTAGPQIALASGAAFAVSEGADGAVYGRLRRRSRAIAVLVSGAVGLVLDTVVFLWLAGFPLTWEVFLGQALVKGAMTGVAAAYVARK